MLFSSIWVVILTTYVIMIPNKAIGTPHAAAVAILLFKVSPKNLKYGVVSVPPPIPSKVLTEPVQKAKVLRNLFLLFFAKQFCDTCDFCMF